MITRSESGSLCVIRQIDHGAVCGPMALRWGNSEFAAPLHAVDLAHACAYHDEAWRFLDERPLLDPATGHPRTFLNMPLERILPAYLDGADRVGRDNPFAGFIVMMHYQGFFNGRFGLDDPLIAHSADEEERKGISAFHAAAEMERGILRARAFMEQGIRIGAALEPATAHAYLVLQVVDVISLFLCLDPTRTWPLGYAARTVGGERVGLTLQPAKGGRVHITPWPFDHAGPIELAIPVRRIPDRAYASDAELADAFAAATWDEQRHSLTPS